MTMEGPPFNPNEVNPSEEDQPSVPLRERSPEEVVNFADRLEQIQAQENSGRGISAARDVVSLLRRGEVDKAEATVRGEWDKFEYTDLAPVLIKAGLYTPIDFSKFNEPEV